MLEIDKNEMERLAQQCPEHLKRTPTEVEVFENKRRQCLSRLLKAGQRRNLRARQRW